MLKHKRFAASSEKPDGQTELFNEAEVCVSSTQLSLVIYRA
nr:hypothetical protein [Zhongshania antarctica]